MATRSIDERYVLLGLRLGKHVDGLVDAYFGPPALWSEVDGEDPATPSALVEESAALLAELENDGDDVQRRRWLTGQVQGLACVAEMAAGSRLPWPEIVRRCYGIDVGVAPEERFSAAHERLDASLPGSGDLATRLDAWSESQNVPAESLLPAFRALVAELREKTLELVELPEDEHLEAETVVDQPWAAYNWYLGNRKSRIQINTDLPNRSYFLAVLVAHECYPGHHTEHACKEARLVDELGRREASILTLHTPECLVSEGVAQVAVEQALGEDWLPRAEEILRPLGIPLDVDTARVVIAAHRDLEDVSVNVAYLASERGWTKEKAVDYHRRWRLSTDERARKAVEFATHPLWSPYVPTYTYGYRLVRDFVGGDDAAFRRLLTEQLTTADLLAPTAAN